MKTSANGIAHIKEFEGFRGKRYLCPAGKWTIGYGHVIRDFERLSLWDADLTEEQATKLLMKDLAERFEPAVLAMATVPLTQGQFDALVSFAFNFGEAKLRSSTLLKLLNAGDYDGARKQINRWVYSNGKKLDGLIRRRARETEMFQ